MSDQDERKRYQWERTRRMKGIILGCAVGNDVIIFQHRSVSLGLPRSIDKSFCKWRGDRARERYWEQYYTHIWGASGIFPRSSASPFTKFKANGPLDGQTYDDDPPSRRTWLDSIQLNASRRPGTRTIKADISGLHVKNFSSWFVVPLNSYKLKTLFKNTRPYKIHWKESYNF